MGKLRGLSFWGVFFTVFGLTSICFGGPEKLNAKVGGKAQSSAVQTGVRKPATQTSKVTTPEVIVPNDFSELRGTWETGCVSQAMNDMSFSFSGNIMTSRITRYLDPACKIKFLSVTQVFKLVPGSRLKATPADARSVDMALVSQTMTPANKELATKFSILYETPMTEGRPSEVTGKGGLPVKGFVTYSIYRVKGNQLQLGDKDSYVKETRPTQFSSVVLTATNRAPHR